MSILIGTTLTTFAMDDPDTWGSWLDNVEQIRDHLPGERVDVFAAIQTDARGLGLFGELTEQLRWLNTDRGAASWWEFRLDDRRTEVTTANRLLHLTTGQNLVSARAVQDPDCSHLLFMAADCQAPDDVLPRLLELESDYCGPFVPTYNLRGEPVGIPLVRDGVCLTIPCERAMPTAAAVLLSRRVFNRLRWRFDPVAGLSDDPALMRDAAELLGISPLVRMDCVARHFPESIGAVETRGHDMQVHR